MFNNGDFSFLLNDGDFSCLLPDPDPDPEPEQLPTRVTAIGRDQMTILACTNGTARKTISPSGASKFRTGKWFTHEQRAVNGIQDICDVIQDIETDPRKFIIRGKPLNPEQSQMLRRVNGDDASMAEISRRWICLDIDSQGVVDATPAAVLKNFVEDIPQLAGVTCVAQVSSSWGIKPGIRAHLWYWLEESRVGAQVSEWAKGLPVPVDHSLFRTVQPHYTAVPAFDDMADPLDGQPRTFLIQGESDSLYIPEGSAESELDHWVEAIRNVGDDPRHPLINRAAFSLGGWVAGGVLDFDQTLEALVEACEDSGVFEDDRLTAARDEIRRALNDGMRHPRTTEDWKSGLIRNKDGAIKLLPENYTRIFKKHPAMDGILAYDVRSQETIVLSAPPWSVNKKGPYPRGVVDNDDTEACAWLNRIGVHTSSLSAVSAAVTAAAYENPFDGVVSWLDNLPAWDRQPRVDNWLPRVAGCVDSSYFRAVGAKMVIAMVARAYLPGCKVDDMPVLIGPQGQGKSTLLRVLASGPGDWAFSDCLGDIHKPQDYMPTIMGPWLVEVPELATFSKKETEIVKKFLSTQSDRYRLSYGRRAVTIPRRCCIAGTSNTYDFLSDMTGNRRFNPIDVGDLDLDLLEREREQIFAEAVVRFRAGEKWYLSGDVARMASDEQEHHRMIDPWEEAILEYLDSPPELDVGSDLADPPKRKDHVTTQEVLTECLEVPKLYAGIAQSRRVSAILKKYGWTRERVRIGRTRAYVYKRGMETKCNI